MPVPSIKRTDFSHGLVHLTRERVEHEASTGQIKSTTHAFSVLKEILISGVLKGSGNEGYIKGTQKAVCFSEIPLSSVHEFASKPTERKAKYRFYGVALSKKAVFSAGGRPVIYLPDDESSWIPSEQKWRHVRFEHGSVDFTHEREWRVLGDFNLTQVPGLYILVWSASEAREISTTETPIKHLIRGILPMEHLTKFL